MKSIRTRLIMLITSVSLIITVLLSVIQIYTVSRFEKRQAEISMNRISESTANTLDTTFVRVEDVVNVMSHAVADYPYSFDDLNDQAYWEEMEEYLSYTYKNAAQAIDGIETFYIRFNEDIYDNKGIYYLLNEKSHEFQKQELMDISEYDDSDTGSVGWYYEPIRKKKAVWMRPYFNTNMMTEMISYACPVYFEGKLLAVVGADILYETVTDILDDAEIYETGYTYLTDLDMTTFYYHPEYETGQKMPEKDVEIFSNKRRDEISETGDELIAYDYSGTRKEMAVTKLTNDMLLVVSAPDAEIYRGMTNAVIESVVASLIVAILTTLLASYVARRMTEPLEQLTKVAKQVEEGDYSVYLEPTTNDEIAVLTHSMNSAVAKINTYVAAIKTVAYQDEMTGVKNQTAYEKYVVKLDAFIKVGDAKFGVVMADMNGLKALNDTYGHAKGDEAIINMSTVICDIFKHSPVYRNGGDEFVVILEGRDLRNVDSLMEELREYERVLDPNIEEPWSRVCLSAGYAEYDANQDKSYLDVFKRADREMYKHKRQMKGV